MSNETIAIVQILTSTVLGAVGILVSRALYLHGKDQRRDSIFDQFSTIHRLFWNDVDMAEVRAWIACNAAYAEVRDVLALRRQDQELVRRTDYAALEKLDKFLNLALGARSLMVRTKDVELSEQWNRLFFKYWIAQIKGFKDTGRHDLYWYVEAFYSELLSDEVARS